MSPQRERTEPGRVFADPAGSSPGGSLGRVIIALAVALSLFHLYTALTGVLEGFLQRGIHLLFILVLTFLTLPASGEGRFRRFLIILAGCAFAVAPLSYIILNHDQILFREPYVTDLTTAQILLGVLLTVAILEATRRTIGLPLVILVGCFLLYPFISIHLPGPISTRGVPLRKLIDQIYLTQEGIFGIPLGVSSTFIFIFILLGSFLKKLGLIELFSDLALSLAGSTRGGAGKVAIIASAFFGTISGSGIGNAVTTGSFTVPMMKRNGFQPHMAAAVESAASMGGQIMPPVMGAAAFIMADILGIPYALVALSAVIPAILYFLAIGVMVHFYAGRIGIPLVPRRELPRVGTLLRQRGFLLAPVGALIYFLAAGRSPLTAGFWCIVAAVAVSFCSRKTAFNLRKLAEALEEGARTALVVGTACAAVGIIIGVVSVTGVGLKIVSSILYLAGGQMIWTLLLTMAAALVLGTGLPTTPSYIITATLLAPALIKLGIHPLAAHMFVFWFSILSDLTPPTAIAPYATAAIAGADHTKTEWMAFALALSGFIVPYVFCYQPSLLLIRVNFLDLALSLASCLLGVTILSAALIGYFTSPLGLPQRGILFIGGILLFVPGLATDLMGLLVLAGVILYNRILRRRYGHANPV